MESVSVSNLLRDSEKRVFFQSLQPVVHVMWLLNCQKGGAKGVR